MITEMRVPLRQSSKGMPSSGMSRPSSFSLPRRHASSRPGQQTLRNKTRSFFPFALPVRSCCFVLLRDAFDTKGCGVQNEDLKPPDYAWQNNDLVQVFNSKATQILGGGMHGLPEKIVCVCAKERDLGWFCR